MQPSIPLLFLDSYLLTTTISEHLACRCQQHCTDSDCNNTGCYETAGSQVFRFEYYYLLSSNPSVGTANQLSAGPWSRRDTSLVIKDVAAIVVAIAVIEPKSKVLLTTANMEKLAGTNGQTSPLVDYTTGLRLPGQLLIAHGKPLWSRIHRLCHARPISGIRLYERYFYLNQ